MKFVDTVEAGFRGARLVAGSALAVIAIVVVALFVVTGVLMAFTYSSPLYAVFGIGIAAIVVGVPWLLVRLGRTTS